MTMRKKRASGLDWKAATIGLAGGVVGLLAAAAVVAMRDSIKGNDVLETVCNAAINFFPALIAAAGAFVASRRKIFNGMIAGWLCELPGLIVAIFMLGFVAPLVAIPLVLAFVVASFYAFIGAVIGTYASRLFTATKVQD